MQAHMTEEMEWQAKVAGARTGGGGGESGSVIGQDVPIQGDISSGQDGIKIQRVD